jgi:hypothetical protein
MIIVALSGLTVANYYFNETPGSAKPPIGDTVLYAQLLRLFGQDNQLL